MQQRPLRLGDTLDDYCPRERRVTNHVVVAMVEETVKQTRCTTCDADHEYKQARVPVRRKSEPAGTPGLGDAGESRPALAPTTVDADTAPEHGGVDAGNGAEGADDTTALHAAAENGAAPDDDGPVHRRLIRATLPRPEGQVPERKEPEFTVRQPGGRGGGREVDGNRVGYHPQGQGQGHGRRARGGQGHGGGQARFGGQRHGHGSRQHGSGFDGPQGGRGGGSRPGQSRGPRQGGGQGRKRGR